MGRREGRGGRGGEGGEVVAKVAIREMGVHRYRQEKVGSGMTNNTHTYSRQHIIAGKESGQFARVKALAR